MHSPGLDAELNHINGVCSLLHSLKLNKMTKNKSHPGVSWWGQNPPDLGWYQALSFGTLGVGPEINTAYAAEHVLVSFFPRGDGEGQMLRWRRRFRLGLIKRIQGHCSILAGSFQNQVSLRRIVQKSSYRDLSRETMTVPVVLPLVGVATVGFTLTFWRLSPASKSTKVWSTLYLCLLISYLFNPEAFKAASVSVRNYVVNEPAKAALISLAVALPLKYLQRKLRFARINAIKWKFGYTDDPASWANMTIEQAQEIEANMAEVGEFKQLVELDQPHNKADPSTQSSCLFLLMILADFMV